MTTFLLFCIVLVLLLYMPLVALGIVTKGDGSMGKKVFIIALVVMYIVSPIDLCPDFIPGLGFGDDIVAGIIGLRQFVSKA